MRHFLFLQGPLGTFYREMGDHLIAAGHRVSRVNFSAGDRADWNNAHSIDYRDVYDNWETWLSQFVVENNVTDILLYGDCRPYHIEAVKLYGDGAEKRADNVNVYVFEEGYLRPNWVTVEKNGVNGASAVPELFAAAPEIVSDYDNIDNMPCGAIMRGQVKACIRHYVYFVLGMRGFPHLKRHRKQRISFEVASWLRWLPKKRRYAALAQRTIDRLIQERKPFYVLPLQLQSDAQVRVHSRFNHLKDFIKEVVHSFSAQAPQHAVLVIKNHPLDNHGFNWRRYCQKIAHRYQLADRVQFIDGGNLPQLLDFARGVVTINSTAGIQAIHHKCPTITMGHAIYDHPQLTFQGTLDDFWTQATLPDEATYRALYAFLVDYCQFNGSYYTEAGRKLLLSHTLESLLLTGKKAVPQPTFSTNPTDDDIAKAAVTPSTQADSQPRENALPAKNTEDVA